MRRWVYRYVWRSRSEGDDWVLFLVNEGPSAASRPYIPAGVASYASKESEHLMVTPDQIERWEQAAAAFLAAVGETGYRYDRTLRWLRRWRALTFGWQARIRRRAERRCLTEVRAARSAYQPIQDEVRHIWDEHVGARAAQREQERRERERERERAQEEYDIWLRPREAAVAAARERAWACVTEGDIVHLSRPGREGPRRLLTAYELALEVADRDPATLSWAPGVREAVEEELGSDTFDSWWARVDATARNVRARDSTIEAVVGTVGRVVRALRAAGSPGTESFYARQGVSVTGWRPSFDWRARTVRAPKVTPPRIPPDRGQGNWDFSWYRRRAEIFMDGAILVPGWDGGSFATITHGQTDYDRHVRRWAHTPTQTQLRLALERRS